MSNLTQRLITGSIFILVLVGGIMWHPFSFAALFLFVTIAGLLEFYKLAEITGAKPQKTYGTIAGAVLFSLFFLCMYYGRYEGIITIFPMLFIPFLVELYRKSSTPFQNIGFTLLGIIYVALPFALWNFIIIPEAGTGEESVEGHYKWHILLGYFIILWTSDSLAYVCGRLFGKHKLFERISPKKTWEGFIGGMIFTIGAAYIVSMFYKDLSPLHWMVVAAIIVTTGTLGDLVESMFKRSIDVKDSGTILPGHGGILDRFDAVLISSPFVCTYLLLVH